MVDNKPVIARIWQSLTPEEQQGVLEAYEESMDEDNFIDLEDIKAKYSIWA
nr:hypothetical protein [uncultured Mucilaginibacter sp.]